MNKFVYSLLVVTTFIQAAAPKTLDISWAVCQRQGNREDMEDTYAAITNFRGKGEYFFAIYDGHGGARSALETAGNIASYKRPKPLHEYVKQAYEMTKAQRNGKDPYTYAFENLDKKFQELKEESGTTAVIAHIKSEEGNPDPVAWIAWAGDSRAIVVRKDGSVSFATKDHMSRSIGAAKVKKEAKGIATPEVERRNLLDRHQFLVLASDGVWNVLSNEEAASIVKRTLAGKIKVAPTQPRPGEKLTEAGSSSLAKRAACTLRDAAYRASEGKSDNISVLVVEFNWH